MQAAINLLSEEKVVAIPTETVYGLAALYDSEAAISAVYSIKGRPLNHPVIIHIGSLEWLNMLTDRVPEYALTLIKHYWPGPLSIIFKKSKNVSDMITAGQDTVAIRMPSHPLCLELLTQLNKPIVAPSANPYCSTSPTKASHVLKYFSDDVPVLEGGACHIGIESTIILATNDKTFEILRPGIIQQEDLERVSGVKCSSRMSHVKSPGLKQSHYSPTIPLIVFEHARGIEQYVVKNRGRFFIMSFDAINADGHEVFIMEKCPDLYAEKLYSLWHQAEESDCTAILLQSPPLGSEWSFILDKINKASHQYKNN